MSFGAMELRVTDGKSLSKISVWRGYIGIKAKQLELRPTFLPYNCKAKMLAI